MYMYMYSFRLFDDTHEQLMGLQHTLLNIHRTPLTRSAPQLSSTSSSTIIKKTITTDNTGNYIHVHV